MLDVFSTTGVLFVLIALGYLSVLKGIFSKDDLRVFGRFVVNFALPALVFRALVTAELADVIDFGYLAAYGAGSVLAFAFGYYASRKGLGMSPAASTFQGMGTSCSNSGFVGYPLLLMTLPALAPAVLALNMVIENLIMIPIVLVLAEMATGRGARRRVVALNVFRNLLLGNPIVIALVLGLVVSMLRIDLPRIIFEPIDIIAASSAAVSLMVIGGTLVGLKLRSVDGRVLVVVIGKLALFPALVWLSIQAFGLVGLVPASTGLMQAAVLNAAVPTAGVYPILAQRYGEEENAAMAMLVMVCVSFFTISFMIAGLGLHVDGGM